MKAYGRIVFPAILFAGGWVLFWATFGMKSLALSSIGPELVPRLITIALLLVSGLLCVFEIRDFRKTRAEENSAQAKEDAKKGKEPSAGEAKGWVRSHAVGLTLALLVVYLLAMEYLGFLLATACYLFAQILLAQAKPGIGRMAVLAAASVLAASLVYLAFVKGLAMPLPEGIFP